MRNDGTIATSYIAVGWREELGGGGYGFFLYRGLNMKEAEDPKRGHWLCDTSQSWELLPPLMFLYITPSFLSSKSQKMPLHMSGTGLSLELTIYVFRRRFAHRTSVKQLQAGLIWPSPP